MRSRASPARCSPRARRCSPTTPPRRAATRRLVPALLLVGPPLATALVLKPEFVALRYFSVPLAGAPILFGRALGRLARLPALVLLGAITALNLARDVGYARAGRGHFREALEYMVAQTPGPSLSLASDLPFDTRLAVEYHARGLSKPIAWFQALPAAGVDWWIVTAPLHPQRLELGGRPYALARVLEAAW